jgi:hypothetical protein
MISIVPKAGTMMICVMRRQVVALEIPAAAVAVAAVRPLAAPPE